MNYKRTVFWVIVTVGVVCVVLAVCFLTNPATKGNAGPEPGTMDETGMNADSVNEPGMNTASGTIFDELSSNVQYELSDNISNLIIEDWNQYEQLDNFQRMVSSHMPGWRSMYFATWDEACGWLGVKPWNPLEKADWLEKANCYGETNSNAAITEHCHVEGQGRKDGTVEFAAMDAGYNYDGVRVVIKHILAGEIDFAPVEDADEEKVNLGFTITVSDENGSERIVNKGLGYDCTAVRRHTDIYDALELHFYKNDKSALVIIMTGYNGPEKVAEAFDRISRYIGLNLTAETIFSDNTDHKASVNVTPLPENDSIPGTDTNLETDVYISISGIPGTDDIPGTDNIPGTDTNFDTDYYISVTETPGADILDSK